MTKRQNKKSIFFLRLFIALCVIVAIVFGGYLTIDRLVVPKYFKEYGIENMHDLVAMMKTLYNSPDEKDMITNGFTKIEQERAVKKLISAGFPTKNNGTEIDYDKIASGFDASMLNAGQYEFSDRHIASLLDQMLETGVLASKLPDIKFIDTMSISILELIIKPEVINEEGSSDEPVYAEDRADVSFTFKFDTTAVRSQMAVEMDTPLFLLNMIIPDTLYLTVNYSIEKTDEGKWVVNNGNIAVNGRTTKDSEILINLFIKFIFPKGSDMTKEKLSTECGNILIQGLDLLGNISIKTNIGDFGASGIVLTID